MKSSHEALVRISAITLLALALTGCRPHDFPQYPPGYREYAYVTNGGSGTVSVFDVVNVRLDREIAVGQNPVAVAASPTRNEVYVVNSGAVGAQGSVSVLNAENNAVAGTIAVHRAPVSIEIDPAGELAYVANSSASRPTARRWRLPTARPARSASSTPQTARFAPSSRAAPAPATL